MEPIRATSTVSSDFGDAMERSAPLSTPPRTLRGHFVQHPQNRGSRRHGAGVALSSSEVLHHGGYGPKGRLSNSDTYLDQKAGGLEQHAEGRRQQPFTHESVCHSLTKMKSGSSLLIGGRKSPNEASRLCYLESRGAWTRVEDLPTGRYRHAAVAFEDGVLVSGGKSDSNTVEHDWLYWENGRGWSQVNFIGDQPQGRFGACATSLSPEFTQNNGSQSSMLLIGGMDEHRKILVDVWQVDLIFMSPEGGPAVRCWQPSLKFEGSGEYISGFGGVLVEQAGDVWLIGGIGPYGYSKHSCEIIKINNKYEASRYQLAAPPNESIPRPMLVGHHVVPIGKDNFMIIGGGATCFSFGTYWNRGCYTVATQPKTSPSNTWALIPSTTQGGTSQPPTERALTLKPVAVRRTNLQSKTDFDQLLFHRIPTVIEGLSIGSCTETWDSDYLKDAIGEQTSV